MKIGFTKFGIDKIYHFYGGLSFALSVLIALLVVQLSGPVVSAGFGAFCIALAALIAGIVKDLYDALIQKEVFDVCDVLFTWLGSVPILIVWILITGLYG